ncbi:MAG: SH3 domain-containing protein [Acidobacteriota bacterium]
MKNLTFTILVLALAACSRDSVERATPPESSTAPAAEVATDTATTTVTGTGQVDGSKPAVPAAGGPTLAFVDEGSRDATFAAYRERLLTAVRAHDAKGVAALADPKIRTSFGSGGGSAELQNMLAKPGMLEELEQILTLGGTFQGDGNAAFWAPYVYSTYPDAQDSFSTLAVIGEGVPLRESANDDAPVVASLSRNIVERASAPGSGEPWTKVKVDGRTGFVESKSLRSPIDYRAGFNKTAAGWQMTALVAGD